MREDEYLINRCGRLEYRKKFNWGKVLRGNVLKLIRNVDSIRKRIKNLVKETHGDWNKLTKKYPNVEPRYAEIVVKKWS